MPYREKRCSLIGLLLLSLLPAMEWSLLKMGADPEILRSWLSHGSSALQLSPCHVPTLHHCSLMCRNHAGLTMPSGAVSVLQELFPWHFFLTKPLAILWNSIFGLRSCFSQGKFILLVSSMDPTAQPYSATVVYSKPARLLNFEFWEVSVKLPFPPPRKLKPPLTNSSTSSL